MSKMLNARQHLTELRALVLGLAREGTALARFLAERGAKVTVTDAKPAAAVSDAVAALAGLPVVYALGGHPVELLDEADVVFVSPGVPLDIPFLVEARRRDLPLSSETRLFTRLCPAPVVGITGSSGKTTTTALTGELLSAAGWQTWIGGNIGRPLISQVDRIRPQDVVVMELSSFQLEFFGPWPASGRGDSWRDEAVFDAGGWSPPVAAILNVTPNHLDRHATMEDYVAAKMHIVAYQDANSVVVLNQDNEITHDIGVHAAEQGRHVLWFSVDGEVNEGTCIRADELLLRLAGKEEVLCRTGDLKLLGRHNLANALAACALAVAASLAYWDEAQRKRVAVETMRQTLLSFSGVDHRLELVREREGVRWYNDSIATTPERAVAALQSFEAPILLLAGGRDKHLPWDEMAALVWHRVRHLILFGEAADLIEGAMHTNAPAAREAGQETIIHQAGTLQKAVDLAAHLARPGDVVLLSPGGTSFDAYRDFVARGEHFRQLVRALE